MGLDIADSGLGGLPSFKILAISFGPAANRGEGTDLLAPFTMYLSELNGHLT